MEKFSTLLHFKAEKKRGTKGIDSYLVTSYNLFPTQTYLRYVRVFQKFTQYSLTSKDSNQLTASSMWLRPKESLYFVFKVSLKMELQK